MFKLNAALPITGENIVGKKRKSWLQAFYPLSQYVCRSLLLGGC